MLSVLVEEIGGHYILLKMDKPLFLKRCNFNKI